MNYARPEPIASRPLAEEQALAPTAAPICPFLGWPVVTDPRLWTAQAAVLGIQHSEPYIGDPRPNDQARTPDAVRLVSAQIYWLQHDLVVDAQVNTGTRRNVIQTGYFHRLQSLVNRNRLRCDLIGGDRNDGAEGQRRAYQYFGRFHPRTHVPYNFSRLCTPASSLARLMLNSQFHSCFGRGKA